MSWLENIQNKPRAYKIRLMWTIGVIVVIFLAAAWVVSAHFQKKSTADTSLFKAIGQGFHNIKENYGK